MTKTAIMCAFLSTVLGGAAASAQQVAGISDDESLYLKRVGQLTEPRQGGGLDSYDPLETVVGAARSSPLLIARRGRISATAIDSARAYVAERNTSAFLIWHEGSLIHESYFGSFNRDTPLVSKSLAKPVTALLVGRAIAQGHIKSLDQPIADFITEWKSDTERSKITIRQLLGMRSGLLAQTVTPNTEDILNRAYLHPRHDEIIIRDYPLTHAPGTRYEYSNANGELIAPLIERATGRRYSQYLSESLLGPIGAAGGTIWLNRPGGMAHSGCCLMLPAQTWLRMAILLMNDGVWRGRRLLLQNHVAEMRTAAPENPYYGLGAWIAGNYIERRGFAHPSIPVGKVLHSAPYLARDLYLFDGNSNQVVYIIPSQRLIILRTGDRPPNNKEWDNAFLPNLLISAIQRRAGESMPEPQAR